MFKSQETILDEYILMSEMDREKRIRAVKANLGSRLVILIIIRVKTLYGLPITEGIL